MRRALLIIIAMPLILIVLAAVLVPMLVDKDKVLGIATTQLKQQTGATLVVGGEVGLSIFPTLGIALEDAALTLPDEDEPSIRARSLAIGVAFGPLLTGNIEIGAISVDGLDATLRQQPAPEAPALPELEPGQSPPPGEAPAPAPDAEDSTGGGSAPPLSIDELSILDSRITLIDTEGEATRVEINEFRAENVNLDARPMTVDGSVSLPDQGLSIALNGDLRFGLAANELHLDGVNLSLGGATPEALSLDVEGKFNLASLAADAALKVATGDTAGNATLSYALAEGTSQASLLTTKGTLSGLDIAQALELAEVELEQAISGMAGATWQLDFDTATGQLQLQELDLNVSGATPEPLSLNAKGTAALEPMAADLTLALASGRARGNATVNYAAAADGSGVQLASKGSLEDLDVAMALALAAVDQDLSGIAGATWSLKGNAADNEALAMAMKGPLKVTLAEGSYQGEPLSVAADGRIDLTKELAELSLNAGLGELTADGSLRYAGQGSPQIDAKLHMNLLDPNLLAALAGPDAAAEAEAQEPSESETTGDEPLPLEPIRAIDTRAEITVDKARYENYEAQNVKLNLRANKGVVRVTSFTGEAYGGKLDMQATFNAAEDVAKFNTKGKINGVQIEQLLAALETEPMLEGKANVNWQLNSTGTTPNQLFNDLRGPIKLRANKSVLKGIGIEKELCKAVALVNQQQMKKELPDGSKFKQLGIDIRMSEGRALLDPINAQLNHAGVKGEGFVDPLTQKFRVTFKAKLSPSLGKMDPACRVNERLTDIEWPLDCRGNLSDDPSELCSVETEDIIADLARNEARRKIEKEAGRALEKLFDRN